MVKKVETLLFSELFSKNILPSRCKRATAVDEARLRCLLNNLQFPYNMVRFDQKPPVPTSSAGQKSSVFTSSSIGSSSSSSGSSSSSSGSSSIPTSHWNPMDTILAKPPRHPPSSATFVPPYIHTPTLVPPHVSTAAQRKRSLPPPPLLQTVPVAASPFTSSILMATLATQRSSKTAKLSKLSIGGAEKVFGELGEGEEVETAGDSDDVEVEDVMVEVVAEAAEKVSCT